jgi:integrase
VKGKDRRLDLGGIDDWSIAEARELGTEASKMLRNRTGTPDLQWVNARRVEYGKVDPPPVELAEPSTEAAIDLRTWTFAQARTGYLAEVKRTLRPATYDDYRQILNMQELQQIEELPVAGIDRKRMAKIVQTVHVSGRERHSEHLASVIRPMWTWLAGDTQIVESGVSDGVMSALKAPRRSRNEWAVPGYVPPMTEVGRILAIARAEVLEPSISRAVELAAFTAQRRLTVVSARKCDFQPVEGGALWNIPSAFMKSGTKRKTRLLHVVPLPENVWQLVQEIMRNTHDPKSEWLFPQFRPRRTGASLSFMSASTLTRALLLMPDVTASPHDLRRAFATHGEKTLGWTRSNSKSILDHGEGHEGSDVTAVHYALHNGTHHKWITMRKWAEAIEAEIAQAIAKDKRLEDGSWLKREIDDARYGR